MPTTNGEELRSGVPLGAASATRYVLPVTTAEASSLVVSGQTYNSGCDSRAKRGVLQRSRM